MRSEIDYFMSGFGELRAHLFLQEKTSVVGADGDSHNGKDAQF
jgi:hypothetical protein